MDEQKRSKHASPTDHGYAWVVLAASCLLRLLSMSEGIMGVLLIELKHSFDASTAEVVAASTTQLGIALCVSIFTSLLVTKYGPRMVVIMGSLLAAGGLIATSFISNIHAFFFTYGIVSGVGISCVGMGSIVPLYDYFDRHKAFALGVLMAGYSAGYLIWPTFVLALFNHYGWRGSFVILAGFQLQGCVLGALIRPFRDNTVKTVATGPSKPSGCASLRSQVKVLRNAYFMTFCVIVMLATTGYSFAPAYLPTMAEGVAASETNATLLVSLFGICNCVSRIVHGILGDVRWIRDNRLTICIYCYAVSGAGKICSIAATTYTHLAVFAAVDGFANGGFLGIMFTIVSDLVEAQHKPMATGILNVFGGFAMIFGNSFSGWMYSYFGNLIAPAVFLGIIQLLTAVLATLLHAHMKLAHRTTNQASIPQIDTVVEEAEENSVA